MVEHVVAASVDHAGLYDRVVEARVADDLFGGRLRLVIRRAAIRTRAQKTHQRNPAHTGAFRRFHHIARSFDVNFRVGLFAEFAIDAGAVGDGITSGEGGSQHAGIGQVARDARHRAWVGRVVAGFRTRYAGEQYDFVALGS